MSAMTIEAPASIAGLKRDERGYPIPWFVEPADPVDFRVMRANALVESVRRACCWICGGPIGAYKAFPLGPLCVVQRFTSEGACHRSCAEWAIQVCPFMANPSFSRSARDLPGNVKRWEAKLDNPGTYAIWITKSPRGGRLCFKPGFSSQVPIIELDDPTEINWYREKRLATRDEVMRALDVSRASLLALARTERHELTYRSMIEEARRSAPSRCCNEF